MQKAVTRAQLPTLEASTLPDQAGYRGLENQLYRVEIHDAGNDARHATFKWSRNNGSVVVPILEIGGRVLTVAPRAGPDSVPFTPGDWLEVSDDEYELQGRAEPLRRVDYVDRRKMRVTLNLPPPSTVGTTPRKHPLLRRWDQKEDEGVKIAQRDGVITVVPKKWIFLEDGVQVRFSEGDYRTGDYWLIPARVATKNVIWPNKRGAPVPMQPMGIRHHFCPLAVVSRKPGGEIAVIQDFRRIISPRANLLG